MTFSWELEKKITRKQTFIRTNLTNEESRSQQFTVCSKFKSVGQFSSKKNVEATKLLHYYDDFKAID